ncbi:MAG TPA: hypothetical protein PLA50_11820, partial [Bacteroidia bacterium]|nr:hypothetical protein [Bacteroidia bacterium]
MSPRLRPLLLLPVLATLVAAAVLWGGVRLSQRERIERVLPEDDTTGRYAGELAEAIRPLEALYQQHLDILCRRHFGNTFELKGRADSLVGIRQVSTLSSNGQVNLVHLADSARSVESELPVPVLDPK